MDSLDNYKILSERMNVLTIYLPCRKIGIASDLRKVKTAVHVHSCNVFFLSLLPTPIHPEDTSLHTYELLSSSSLHQSSSRFFNSFMNFFSSLLLNFPCLTRLSLLLYARSALASSSSFSESESDELLSF